MSVPFRPLMVQEAEAQAVAPGAIQGVPNAFQRAKPGPTGTGATLGTGCPGCGGVASHRYDEEDEEKTGDAAVTSGEWIIGHTTMNSPPADRIHGVDPLLVHWFRPRASASASRSRKPRRPWTHSSARTRICCVFGICHSSVSTS